MNNERKEWLSRKPNDALAHKLGIAAWIVSSLVLILVVVMRAVKLPLPDGWSTAALPPFHAALNTLVAVVLVMALAAILKGKVRLHRNLISAAMAMSALFLLSYVAYHITTSPVRYGGTGAMRTVYFVLLVSHIVLAGLSLPFILFTYIAGLTNRFPSHRKLARWVYPMWLYVAVTGPICYWMLRPYYP